MRISVKTAKHILLGNVNPTIGKLDDDRDIKALMMHKNTPCQQTGISSAIASFQRLIRDHLPIRDIKLQRDWQETADKQENSLAKQHLIQKISQI